MKSSPFHRNFLILAGSIASPRRAALAAFGLILSQIPANASTYWWDTTTANTWGTPYWSDNFYSGGTTTGTPGSSDIGIFNQAGITAAATTVNLGADASAAGLVFNNTQATTIQSPTTHYNLTLGSGGILVNGGTNTVSLGDAAFANYLNAVQLNADQSWVNNSATTLTLNSNVKALTANRALTIGGTGATTFLIGLQNNGANTTSLVKDGSGILTFTDATAGTGAKFTFTGGITANAGKILLNSTASSTSGFTNTVASQALTLGGGALVATWANTVTSHSNTQSFTGTTLNAGASAVGANNSQVTSSATKNAKIDLGAITRNAGSTVNFSATGNTTGADYIYIISSSFGASSIVLDSGVAYATAVTSTASNTSPAATSDNWAFADASKAIDRVNFTPSYTTVAAGGTLAAATNADVTGSPLATNSVALASLRLSTGASTITINGGQTLTTGGILVASTAGATSITGGTLNSAATALNKDLVIIQNNGANSLDLTGTVIANSAYDITNSGATGLTKSGAGGLALNSAANTYTGPTYINGGWIQISSDGTTPSTGYALGYYPGSTTANAITLNGGGLSIVTNDVTLGANRGMTLGGNGGTFYAANSKTLTVNGVITSSTGASTPNSYGALQFSTANNSTNTGTVVLGGNNTFVGGVTINAGELKLAASNAGALNSSAGSENTVIMNQSSTAGLNGATTGAGTLLTLNGNSITIGDLKGSGAAGALPAVVQNASATAATLTIGNSNNLSGSTFNGLIQDGSGGGALSLVKTGVGTLTLAPSLVRAGTGTSGQTTVTVTSQDESFLQTGMTVAGTGLGTNAQITNLGANGVLTLSVANTGTVSGNLTFSLKLNTYTGSTTIKNGVLTVTGTQGLPSSTSVILGDAANNTAGILTMNNSNSVQSIATAGTAGVANLISISTGVGMTVNGSGTQTFGGTIGGGGNFTYSGSGSLNVTGKMTSGGTVTASGTGNLILSSANTITGGVAVNNGAGGSLTVTDPKAFGNTSGITFNSGNNAKLVINTASTLLNGDGSAFSRPISGPSSTGGTYSVNVDYTNAGGVAFTQDLSGATFNLGGSSTANLNANGSSYTSGTAVLALGNMIFGTALAGQGGTITPANIAVTVQNVTPNNPNVVGAMNLNLAGTSTGNQITGVIANNGATLTAINKSGTSTWTLGGNNSFGGAVAVTGGTLKITNGNALGFGGAQTTATNGTTVGSGYTLDLSGSTGINEPITISGTGIGANGALINSSGSAASIGNGIAGLAVPATGSGTGLSVAPSVTISGTGTGAAATALLGLTTASIGSITNGGTGWAVNDTLSVTGGGGAGAIATVTSVSGGVITGLSITNAGAGYTGAPTTLTKLVSATGAGTPAATFNTTNFTVGGIQLTAAGSGYTGTPTATWSGGSATPTLSSVTLAANSSVGGSGDITISAVLAESGGAKALTKVGAGTLTLGGTGNSFTGGLNVNAGTLNLTGTITGANAVVLAQTSTNTPVLNVSGGGLLTFSSIAKSGTTGTLGTINLDNGTLKSGAVAAIDNVLINIKSGGAIIDTTGGNITCSVALADGSSSSNDSVTVQGGNTLTLSGTSANTYLGLTTVSSGELDLNKTAGIDSIAGNVTISGGTLKWLANNQVNNGSSITMTSGAMNLNGVTETITSFSNSGGTFTTGAGTLIGTGATVTWSGGTNTINNGGSVQDGHIVISGGTNTVQGGASGGVLQLNGGGTGLEMSGGSVLTLNSDASVAGKLKLSGNVSSSGDSTVTIANGGASANKGTIDLNGGTRTFTVANGSAATDMTISAVIANGSLTKAGLGTLELSAANTYSGTTLSAGTLQISGSGTLGSTGGGLTVNGGILDLGTTTQTVGAVNITAGTLQNGILNFGSLNVAGDTSINIGFTGSGNVTISSGNVTLGGTASGWSGLTTVSGGVVNISSGAPLGSAGLQVGAGTLNLTGTSFTVASLSVSGGNLNMGSSSISSAGAVTISGGTVNTGGNTISGATVTQNGGTVTGGGAVTATSSYVFDTSGGDASNNANLSGGASVIFQGGTGTTTLGGTNSYSGGTTVNSGTTFKAGASSAVSGNSAFTVNGTLDLNGNSATISNLGGSGTVTSTGGTVTVNGGSFGGAIQGGLGLTTTGSFALGGANTYSGATLVSGGSLTVSGSTGSSSAVTVNNGASLAVSGGTIGSSVTIDSGATLTGTGTISGATTISGTHAPGSGGQTFSSSLNYGANSIFEWDINLTGSETGTNDQGAYGKVVANGAVSGPNSPDKAVFKIVLGGTTPDGFWNTDKTWNDIFTGSGTYNLASVFSLFGGNVNADGTMTGFQGHFTFNGGNTLTWTAVPEPTSALVGLLIGAGMLRRRRTA